MLVWELSMFNNRELLVVTDNYWVVLRLEMPPDNFWVVLISHLVQSQISVLAPNDSDWVYVTHLESVETVNVSEAVDAVIGNVQML